MFRCYIINVVRDTVTRSYYCLKLDTKAVVEEVVELLKDNRFTLGSLVNIKIYGIA